MKRRTQPTGARVGHVLGYAPWPMPVTTYDPYPFGAGIGSREISAPGVQVPAFCALARRLRTAIAGPDSGLASRGALADFRPVHLTDYALTIVAAA